MHLLQCLLILATTSKAKSLLYELMDAIYFCQFQLISQQNGLWRGEEKLRNTNIFGCNCTHKCWQVFRCNM